MSEKCRTQKYTNEMTFDEFVSWATAHILFGVAEGGKLRDLVWSVVNQVTLNEVFGGQRKDKK